MSTLLQVKHLKKYFPTKSGLLHAVDNVSFSIEEGRTLGVVGESGCGKSTLCKMVLRLHRPDMVISFWTGDLIWIKRGMIRCSSSWMCSPFSRTLTNPFRP